jgi:hypothetical protein
VVLYLFQDKEVVCGALMRVICRSFSSVIVPFSSRRVILFLSCFIIVHSASGFIGAPVTILQIDLTLASFLNGCSFSQSRTYGHTGSLKGINEARYEYWFSSRLGYACDMCLGGKT